MYRLPMPDIPQEDVFKVMAIISEAGYMGFIEDEAGAARLMELNNQLAELCERPADIMDFVSYCGMEVSDLTEAAKELLLPVPKKTGLSDEEIADVIRAFPEYMENPRMVSYVTDVLAVETGIDNIADFIMSPADAGLSPDADAETIIAEILKRRER